MNRRTERRVGWIFFSVNTLLFLWSGGESWHAELILAVNAALVIILAVGIALFVKDDAAEETEGAAEKNQRETEKTPAVNRSLRAAAALSVILLIVMKRQWGNVWLLSWSAAALAAIWGVYLWKRRTMRTARLVALEILIFGVAALMGTGAFLHLSGLLMSLFLIVPPLAVLIFLRQDERKPK